MATKKNAAAKTSTMTVDGATGEVVENASGLPAIVNASFAAVADDEVVVKKMVTIPILQWPDGARIVFTPISAIVLGKEMKGERAGTVKMEPAELLDIKATNGEVRRLIVGSVLASELREAYPKDAYVGKWFRAAKFAPNSEKGKRYATYEIHEIEPPK